MSTPDPFAVEIVEVDSGRGPAHCECWEWEEGAPMYSGQYAGTVDGPGALPAAIRRAFDVGASRVVVHPLLGNVYDPHGREIAP